MLSCVEVEPRCVALLTLFTTFSATLSTPQSVYGPTYLMLLGTTYIFIRRCSSGLVVHFVERDDNLTIVQTVQSLVSW